MNKPAYYNDPSGALTTEQLETVVNSLWAMPDGGSWHAGSGGQGAIFGGIMSMFSSADQAFGWASAYMTSNGLWASQKNWARSFGDALGVFTGGDNKITSGMVQGYFQQHWAGTDHDNISANDATGKNAGSFKVGWSYRDGVPSDGVGISANFVTSEEMMRRFEGLPTKFQQELNKASDLAGIASLELSGIGAAVTYGVRNAAILGKDFVKSPILGKVMMASGVILSGIGTTNAAIALYNKPTKGNTARLVVQTIGLAANFIPVAGWGISLGISVLDMAFGNKFYNWLDSN